MKNYFEVVAKCGHVGRRFYYRGVFYIAAEDGKAAAKAVREFPRVKHDHRDAILQVTRVSEEEYLEGWVRYANDPYFRCKNIQEQGIYWEEISAHIYPEENFWRRRRSARTAVAAARTSRSTGIPMTGTTPHNARSTRIG